MDHLALKMLHRNARSAVHEGDIVGINNMYEHIDEYDNYQLITLLRVTSVYKESIPLWTYTVLKAYNICKELELNPRKELWGLI